MGGAGPTGNRGKKMDIETYYQNQVAEELAAWARKVGAPASVNLEGVWLYEIEQRHGAIGFVWSAEFTGEMNAKGWMSLDGNRFDMDQRPDA